LGIVGVFSGQQNHFVQLSALRMIEILCLVEITLGFLLLIVAMAALLPISTSANSEVPGFSLPICMFLGVFWLISSDKVPFDLVEAESELIDGITVDLGGAFFSMVYAGEAVFVFVSAKLFLVGDFGFVWITFSVICAAIFVGRIFVARFLLSNLENLLFSVGLSASGLLFALVGTGVGQSVGKFCGPLRTKTAIAMVEKNMFQ
jgi:NADH:ubiquinone oxidoreductase subunit H